MNFQGSLGTEYTNLIEIAGNLIPVGGTNLNYRIDSRIFLAVGLASLQACATGPEPIESPMLFTDNVELFRRTRFQELATTEGAKSDSWLKFLNRRRALSDDHRSILELRSAYAGGSAKQVSHILQKLPQQRPAHRLFSALLENVEVNSQIRHLEYEKKRIRLPLNSDYLLRGIPVVKMRIYGREFSFLWDTGSTENIMSNELADELELVRTDVHFPVKRDRDGYVVRIGAAHTSRLNADYWKWSNVPWLISDLRVINQNLSRMNVAIDGVLSPQLLIPESCFIIDREKAVLELFATRSACVAMRTHKNSVSKMYEWNGEIYTSVQILSSPLVGARLETGSNATFLRHDAVRYLPPGSLTDSIVQFRGEIARSLDKDIPLSFAGRVSQMSAIELEASRMTTGHDDLATLGTDLLLQAHDRLWVDFSTMTLGFLSADRDKAKPKLGQPGGPKLSQN